MPGVPGFWMAAGLSLNGFGGAGGIGKAVAELDHRRARASSTSHAVPALALRRRLPRHPVRRGGRARGLPLLLPPPLPARRATVRAARGGSAAARAPAGAGAVFGGEERLGARRLLRAGPALASRRGGPARVRLDAAAVPRPRSPQEHAAIRERRRHHRHDARSARSTVEGPGALALLERVCDNRIDRPAGASSTRSSSTTAAASSATSRSRGSSRERFRVVTGAGAVDSDLGWLRLNVARDGDAPVDDPRRDRRAGVIGLWGPAAPRSSPGGDRATTSPARPSRSGPRARSTSAARRCSRSASPTSASSASSSTCHPRGRSRSGTAWSRRARARHRPVGYRCSTRCGSRRATATSAPTSRPRDTPDEAGLGFCVAIDKGDFTGREALARRAPSRRVAGCARCSSAASDYLTVYGGEAVHAGGAVVGRVRSCAYGFTVRRNVALAYLPAALERGRRVEVEVFGEPRSRRARRRRPVRPRKQPHSL